MNVQQIVEAIEAMPCGKNVSVSAYPGRGLISTLETLPNVHVLDMSRLGEILMPADQAKYLNDQIGAARKDQTLVIISYPGTRHVRLPFNTIHFEMTK